MKHKSFWFALIVILASLAVLPMPVSAQDGLPGCSDDEIAATLAEAADLLAQAREQSGIDALDALIDVKATLAAVEHCRGLDFEGDGTNAVFDPVEIPAGFYRVTVTGSVFVYGNVFTGMCGGEEEGGKFSLIAVGSEGTGQATLQSDGCTVVWETILSDAPYTVTFEKMR